MMTSNYVMVSIKLCLDVGNDEYIITGLPMGQAQL